jgi:hypothetical protein
MSLIVSDIRLAKSPKIGHSLQSNTASIGTVSVGYGAGDINNFAY